jgi:hypothetical protein
VHTFEHLHRALHVTVPLWLVHVIDLRMERAAIEATLAELVAAETSLSTWVDVACRVCEHTLALLAAVQAVPRNPADDFCPITEQ